MYLYVKTHFSSSNRALFSYSRLFRLTNSARNCCNSTTSLWFSLKEGGKQNKANRFHRWEGKKVKKRAKFWYHWLCELVDYLLLVVDVITQAPKLFVLWFKMIASVLFHIKTLLPLKSILVQNGIICGICMAT